jgi:hypothetical protein
MNLGEIVLLNRVAKWEMVFEIASLQETLATVLLTEAEHHNC